LAARPGQVERTDYEYQRHGQANLFLLFAPLEAWREVHVHKTRNASDYAYVIRYLVDECFAQADKIVLVQDNLSTHHASSLYQTFPPDEAARLVQKLELHYQERRQLQKQRERRIPAVLKPRRSGHHG
jgi:hypothetical protein